MNTKGLIKSLIPAGMLTPLTVMVLVSAIYFKGVWESPFDKSLTSSGVVFAVDGGTNTKVAMMFRQASFRHEFHSDFTFVRLPYADGAVAMDVFVPTNTSTVKDLVERNIFSYGFETQHSVDAKLTLFMPRFKMEFAAGLEDYLKKMGLTEPFGNLADFRNMVKWFVLLLFPCVCAFLQHSSRRSHMLTTQ